MEDFLSEHSAQRLKINGSSLDSYVKKLTHVVWLATKPHIIVDFFTVRGELAAIPRNINPVMTVVNGSLSLGCPRESIKY